MSLISANTLFHFTPTKKALLSILEGGFRPAYSKEFGASTDDRLTETEIPMVCFCDLPLSALEKHINGHEWMHRGQIRKFEGYGKYGLGMSKVWGTTQKMNPVTYATNNSHYLEENLEAHNRLLEVYSHLRAEVDTLIDGYEERGLTEAPEDYSEPERLLLAQFTYVEKAINATAAALNYVKPYEDARNGQRYYDEREWRKVVPFDPRDINCVPVIMTSRRPDVVLQKDLFKERITKFHMLNFMAQDIKYIIVKDDKDIEDVVENLINNSSKYPEKEINRLTTRILTCEQIHEDF